MQNSLRTKAELEAYYQSKTGELTRQLRESTAHSNHLEEQITKLKNQHDQYEATISELQESLTEEREKYVQTRNYQGLHSSNAPV